MALAVNLGGSHEPVPLTEVVSAHPEEIGLSTDVRADTPVGDPAEAVRVHGHWTIEIREPDGSLARSVEFDNALVSAGADALTRILSRSRSVGTWQIVFAGSTGSTNPCLAGRTRVSCTVFEAEDAAYFDAPWFFPTLRRSVPTTGSSAGTLVLTGNATAQVDGDVAWVGTELGVCGSGTPPTTCNTGSSVNGHAFTGVALQPSQIQSVRAGQQISVTVVISFR